MGVDHKQFEFLDPNRDTATEFKLGTQRCICEFRMHVGHYSVARVLGLENLLQQLNGHTARTGGEREKVIISIASSSSSLISTTSIIVEIIVYIFFHKM